MNLATILARLVRLPQALLMAVVQGYRLLLSPWLGSACRFTPTCSAYALDALGQHGALGGSYLTIARLARCHPWCAGGHNPVPTHIGHPKLFSSLPGLHRPASNTVSPPTSVSKTLL